MIYESIVDRLRLRLNSADFTIGNPLPGKKKLAEGFRMARVTIRKAIGLLVDWGLVVRRHGSGMFVARKDVHHETSNLTGLAKVLRKQGKEVVNQALAFKVIPIPPAIASLLQIKIDKWAYFSWRVHYADGKPLTLENSYMSVKLFHNLSLSYLGGSKFDYIEEERGIIISGNYETLTPVLTNEQLAHSVNVPERTPPLRITSLSYSNNGEFLSYSAVFRNASKCQVDYHLRRVQAQNLLAQPPERHGG